MHKRTKLLPFLFISILSFAAFFYLFFNIDPLVNFDILFFSLPPILFFFLSLTVGLLCLFYFLMMNVRRSILITCYIVGILLLRYFGYKSWVHIAFLFI